MIKGFFTVLFEVTNKLKKNLYPLVLVGPFSRTIYGQKTRLLEYSCCESNLGKVSNYHFVLDLQPSVETHQFIQHSECSS